MTFSKLAVCTILMLLACGNQLSAQLSASSTDLYFGRDASLRSSVPLPSTILNPGSTVISTSNPAGILWDIPHVGSIYAAVPVGSITVGTLLTSANIATYGCQGSVIYEAPNHPFTIQAMMQGGLTNVGGTVCGSADPVKTTIPIQYGRKKLSIGVADGKVTLGQPTQVTITAPPDFLPFSMLRIDFGTEVVAFGGIGRVITVPFSNNPMSFSVVYPATYQGMTVGIEAIATTGGFVSATPLFASGDGVPATGATVSNTASFPVIKATDDVKAISIAVTMTASRTTVRRGGLVRYTYTVTNSGATDLRDVVVNDNQVGEVGRRARLAAGQAVVFNSDVRITSAMRSHAFVTAAAVNGTTTSAQSDDVRVEVINPAINVRVWADPGRSTKVGQQITIRYSVENVGDVALGPVRVTDITDGSTVISIATLDVGQSSTAQRAVVVVASERTRSVRATAGVPADPTGPDVDATASETLDIRSPNIGIALTADKLIIKSGGSVTLSVTAQNTGDIELFNLNQVLEGVSIGSQRELGTGAEATATSGPTTLTSTTTFNAIVTAADNWGDPHSATAQIRVRVVNPAISASARANGSSTKVRVAKGSTVNFQYSITNSGNCDLEGVKVYVEGNEVGTFDVLAPGQTKSLPSQSEVIDKDVTRSIHVIAKDPMGAQVSADDKVLVEARGLFSGIQASIDAAKKLCADIDIYKQKIDNLYQEFKAGVLNHTIAQTDPCADGRLATVIQEAQTYLKQYEDAYKALQTESQNLGKIALSNPEFDEILDLIQKALGGASGKVQAQVAEMKSDWAALHCGDPVVKDHMVNVIVTVVDDKGAAVSGCTVGVDKSSGTTTADGRYVVSIPLAKDEVVQAHADIKAANGIVYSGAAQAQYKQGDELPITIQLQPASLLKVQLNGRVLDANGKGVPGIVVYIDGGVSTTTDASGGYTLNVEVLPGAVLVVRASVSSATARSSQTVSTPSLGSEGPVSVAPLVFSNYHVPQNKKVTRLELTPANPRILVNERIEFSATATYEDNSQENVSDQCQWDNGNKAFESMAEGKYTKLASFGGMTATTSIITSCAPNYVWNEQRRVCEKKDDEDTVNFNDVCDKNKLSQDLSAIVARTADLQALEIEFNMKAATFEKNIRDQKADPCKNLLLASALVGAENLIVRSELIITDIADRSSTLLGVLGICPGVNSWTVSNSSQIVVTSLQTTGQIRGRMKVKHNSMISSLRTLGCDTNEVRQNGNTVAENQANSNSQKDGGNGAVEICGDGIDNNDNGLIDEGCADLSNANVLFVVYDNGVKDDIFELSLAGRVLGQSPTGGRSEFGAQLQQGDYVLKLRVIEDGESKGSCCGTYALTILQNGHIITSSTGNEPRGTVVDVPFRIEKTAFLDTRGNDIQGIEFLGGQQQEGRKR